MKLKLREHNLPGKLIVFCGLDGSGKTTMIRKLTKKLEEKAVNPILTKQPTKAMRKSEIFRTYMDCEDHSGYAYRSLALMAAAGRKRTLYRYGIVISPAGGISSNCRGRGRNCGFSVVASGTMFFGNLEGCAEHVFACMMSRCY